MKNLKLLALTLCFYFTLHATESSNLPPYYTEFKAAMSMINKLHGLVNETDIEVKCCSNIRNGSLFLDCDRNWNTTDQGIIAYFEEAHLTKVYTPLGSLKIFWLTRADKRWDLVLEKFKESCTLQKKPLTLERSGKVKDTYPILSIDNKALPLTTKIMHGDQKRTAMLTACIAHYLQEGGTLTELDSLGKRKKRLAEQIQTRTAQASYRDRPLDILFNMLDLSS